MDVLALKHGFEIACKVGNTHTSSCQDPVHGQAE
jgi:hypothetical protein